MVNASEKMKPVTLLDFSAIRFGEAIGHAHEVVMRELFIDRWHEWVDSL